MDRRHFIAAGMAGVVAVGATLPVLASTSATASPYYAELDAIDAFTRALNAERHPESDWDRWEAWTNRVYREIEALPPTPENAKIKARAVWSITSGNMEDLNAGQSTCCRMVRQIISGFAAGGN